MSFLCSNIFRPQGLRSIASSCSVCFGRTASVLRWRSSLWITSGRSSSSSCPSIWCRPTRNPPVWRPSSSCSSQVDRWENRWENEIWTWKKNEKDMSQMFGWPNLMIGLQVNAWCQWMWKLGTFLPFRGLPHWQSWKPAPFQSVAFPYYTTLWTKRINSHDMNK